MRTGGLTMLRMLLVLMLGVAAFGVLGCGSDDNGSSSAAKSAPATKGGTLNVADAGEAINLNAMLAGDNYSEYVIAQISEPLYRTDGKGKVIPWLATDGKSSADGLTWTFTLRPGVKYSDGTPLKAADVAFSLNLTRKNPNWAGMFSPVKAVKAVDDSTVEIKLKQPWGAIKETLAFPLAAIVPNNYGGVSAKKFDQNPIGTGPFKLQTWDHGRSITLVRNPTYWNAKRPYLDKVVFHVVNNNNSRALQLRGKKLQLIHDPPNSQISTLDKAPGLAVRKYALGFPDILMLNERSALFGNDKVREAVQLGIDRNAIVKAALIGNGQAAGSWLPPALRYHDSSIKFQQDTAKAKQLLADAVKNDGVDPSYTMKIAAGDEFHRLASQIIQANLQDVGFKVKIQPIDGNALYAQTAEGKYQSSLFGITSDIIDPSEVFGFYLGLDSFWTFAPKEEVQKLFDQAVAEPDTAKQEQLYKQMQKLIADENAVIALDYRPFTWAMDEKVTGFDLPPTGVPWLADTGFAG